MKQQKECEEVRSLMLSVDGQWPDQVLEHCRVCRACREFGEFWERAKQVELAVSPAKALDEKILTAARMRKVSRKRIVLFRPFAVAAALALCFAVYIWWRNGQSGNVEATSPYLTHWDWEEFEVASNELEMSLALSQVDWAD